MFPVGEFGAAELSAAPVGDGFEPSGRSDPLLGGVVIAGLVPTGRLGEGLVVEGMVDGAEGLFIAVESEPTSGFATVGWVEGCVSGLTGSTGGLSAVVVGCG